MKVSRHFVSRLLLCSIATLLSSNKNEYSTKLTARIYFIVRTIDFAISICRCNNTNSFFTALILGCFGYYGKV